MTDEKRAINQAAAAERLTRRKVISVAALSGLGLRLLGADPVAFARATDEHTGPDEHRVLDNEIRAPVKSPAGVSRRDLAL